jgi:hypothetical protein
MFLAGGMVSRIIGVTTTKSTKDTKFFCSRLTRGLNSIGGLQEIVRGNVELMKIGFNS